MASCSAVQIYWWIPISIRPSSWDNWSHRLNIMIRLYQPSNYLKKLVVEKSDEIFAPSDPLYPSLPNSVLLEADLYRLHQWALLSFGFWLSLKNGEHQQKIRGYRFPQLCLHRISTGQLHPSAEGWLLSDSPLRTAESPQPLSPLASPDLEVVTASQYYYLQGDALSLPGFPTNAFVNSPSVTPSSVTQFECAICFQARP